MIATISGRVADLGQDNATIDIGGVGLQIFIPAPQLDAMKTGEMVSLYTFLAVREDSLTLYGFGDAEGKKYFILLTAVNGIGPKLALTILSTLNPEAIRHAVLTEQTDVFHRVPGIGKKTAQKIIFYLQDRIGSIDDLEPLAVMNVADTEVMEALVALGYSVVEAGTALQSIPKDTPDDVETRLRVALQNLSNL
ncbi:MAG: Holliday junction branch migration protein RuvA [Chloroflexi bacterium]|nr:Holliday junction branch migration protein RuvA [Chloroflexota bacterium]